jgi:hypothetical protein
MQKEAVAHQVDQAVAVSWIVCEPRHLQVELAQEDLLGPHRGSDGQAPAPGHPLKVLGRRSILLPALRNGLGSITQDTDATIGAAVLHSLYP